MTACMIQLVRWIFSTASLGGQDCLCLGDVLGAKWYWSLLLMVFVSTYDYLLMLEIFCDVLESEEWYDFTAELWQHNQALTTFLHSKFVLCIFDFLSFGFGRMDCRFGSISPNSKGVGNLRKCGMRKVICGMKSAEVGCGTVGNMRNDWPSDRLRPRPHSAFIATNITEQRRLLYAISHA